MADLSCLPSLEPQLCVAIDLDHVGYQFREAIISSTGYDPGEIQADKAIHRFSTSTDQSKKDGWYCLHLDNIPAGSFGDWRTGLSQSWRADIGRELTTAENKEYRAILSKIKTQREREEREQHQRAAVKAQKIWDECSDCSGHPYLTCKGIMSHGVRITDRGQIIIPVRISGEITSLQFIDESGKKRFLSGGKIKGGYFPIGKIQSTDRLIICEGFATGATLHEATGYPVAVSFNAGNLSEVSKSLHARYPNLKLLIAADDDHQQKGNPGMTKATEAAREVGGVIAVPEFGPDRGPEDTDFNDLGAKQGNAAVKDCIEKALNPPANSRKVKAVTIADFLRMEFPPRENLLNPWLPKQGLCMVHAYRGVGKTHFSLGVACAVATGSSFMKWQSEKQAGVLFIDGEMPGVVLQERLAQTMAGMNGSFENVIFEIITPDMQEYGVPDLATIEGQTQIDPYITDEVELVVLDNISTLCGSVQENKGDTWRPIQDWLLRLRARGKSVLLVHHDGKGGGQRGTSKKEDILDTVIQLRHPTQYSPTDGAVFEVHFMKNRGLHGEEAEPFEASLQTINGLGTWTTRKLEDSTRDKVEKLLSEGYSQKDIAEELGKSKGYISKIVKRIKVEE